ncbi:MAG: phosphoadenosine phosphosulfate reductase family protein, partial [Lachnospiraceae bacterium]|nr:phosphoadenosine phosphosulfate reductase family protein [Lachnospiraceae bacterium]
MDSTQSKMSKEPRPVYYKELDILGFDAYWNYPKDDSFPLMWAEANNYIYKGKLVARTKGGSLYTKPEIIILEEPEAGGTPLQFVDIEAMCWKNRDLMETLVQETIQNVYNRAYLPYKEKVDVFYVAFSGGKDSVVALDIVQRALPHNEFKVLFGDTGMEFSDTYAATEMVRNQCEDNGIEFITASSDFDPVNTWSKFGPPCTVTRWCCSVHKTAPQILKLREILNKPNFKGMAFVGVRADESVARSKYEYITYGGKHKGQYSCNVILNWSSAEIFLYIYSNYLILNETYKKGNRRAGCLVCPRASERNDYMNHLCYADDSEPFVESIRKAYKSAFSSEERLQQFIEAGGWKARKNGRDIDIPLNYKELRTKKGETKITINNPRTNWKTWIKTIGILSNDSSPYSIKFQGKILSFKAEESEDEIAVEVDADIGSKHPEFVKLLKNVFRKASCCIGCRECEADCPYGCINFIDGDVYISDQCRHCSQCHKIEKGCLVYKSLEQPKGGIIMSGKNMSLNSYSHHAPKIDWIRQYFEYKNDFDSKNSLGSQMYNFFKRFLRDANLIDETGFSMTAEIVDRLGYENEIAWGIIYTNLCYSPQVNWFVNTIDFNDEYTKSLIASLMVEAGAKETWTNDIFSSLTRLSELPMGKIGFGKSIKEKTRAVGIIRLGWENPAPEVILYALYKFAEACGDYYQFSLETLMDDTIERDGVSPTRIFGLDRDTMVRILNGLSNRYSDFISASFVLDLDNISLQSDKTAEDVLNRFKCQGLFYDRNKVFF